MISLLLSSIQPFCYSLEIREALETDNVQIAHVHYKSWHDTYKDIHSATLIAQHTPQWFLEYWHKKFYDMAIASKNFVLVVVDQNKIVGFLMAGTIHNYQWLLQEHDCEIHKFYLLPETQKQGIGTQLFLACMQKLRTMGFSKMLIRTLKENIKSCQFCRKHGGVCIKEQTCEVDDIVHEAFYSFDLNVT